MNWFKGLLFYTIWLNYIPGSISKSLTAICYNNYLHITLQTDDEIPSLSQIQWAHNSQMNWILSRQMITCQEPECVLSRDRHRVDIKQYLYHSFAEYASYAYAINFIGKYTIPSDWIYRPKIIRCPTKPLNFTTTTVTTTITRIATTAPAIQTTKTLDPDRIWMNATCDRNRGLEITLHLGKAKNAPLGMLQFAVEDDKKWGHPPPMRDCITEKCSKIGDIVYMRKKVTSNNIKFAVNVKTFVVLPPCDYWVDYPYQMRCDGSEEISGLNIEHLCPPSTTHHMSLLSTQSLTRTSPLTPTPTANSFKTNTTSPSTVLALNYHNPKKIWMNGSCDIEGNLRIEVHLGTANVSTIEEIKYAVEGFYDWGNPPNISTCRQGGSDCVLQGDTLIIKKKLNKFSFNRLSVHIQNDTILPPCDNWKMYPYSFICDGGTLDSRTLGPPSEMYRCKSTIFTTTFMTRITSLQPITVSPSTTSKMMATSAPPITSNTGNTTTVNPMNITGMLTTKVATGMSIHTTDMPKTTLNAGTSQSIAGIPTTTLTTTLSQNITNMTTAGTTGMLQNITWIPATTLKAGMSQNITNMTTAGTAGMLQNTTWIPATTLTAGTSQNNTGMSTTILTAGNITTTVSLKYASLSTQSNTKQQTSSSSKMVYPTKILASTSSSFGILAQSTMAPLSTPSATGILAQNTKTSASTHRATGVSSKVITTPPVKTTKACPKLPVDCPPGCATYGANWCKICDYSLCNATAPSQRTTKLTPIMQSTSLSHKPTISDPSTQKMSVPDASPATTTITTLKTTKACAQLPDNCPKGCATYDKNWCKVCDYSLCSANTSSQGTTMSTQNVTSTLMPKSTTLAPKTTTSESSTTTIPTTSSPTSILTRLKTTTVLEPSTTSSPSTSTSTTTTTTLKTTTLEPSTTSIPSTSTSTATKTTTACKVLPDNCPKGCATYDENWCKICDYSLCADSTTTLLATSTQSRQTPSTRFTTTIEDKTITMSTLTSLATYTTASTPNKISIHITKPLTPSTADISTRWTTTTKPETTTVCGVFPIDCPPSCASYDNNFCPVCDYSSCGMSPPTKPAHACEPIFCVLNCGTPPKYKTDKYGCPRCECALG